jgi:hypothetical protein
MSLSERLRPDVECAPWVIAEVKFLEAELSKAREREKELKLQRYLEIQSLKKLEKFYNKNRPPAKGRNERHEVKE